MSQIRVEQIYGAVSLFETGSQYLSGSLNVSGSVSALIFSGSGLLLSNIPLTAITGINALSGWVLSGANLHTSQSYHTAATGSLTVLGDVSDVFIVKSISQTQNLLKVMSTGVTQFYVHASDPVAPAGYGQVYFTSASLFVGVD